MSPLSGDLATWAMTLNDRGHVIGVSTTDDSQSFNAQTAESFNRERAIFYSAETGTVALSTLNGSWGLPAGINKYDQIVGDSITPDGKPHAFLTRPGAEAVDLNSLLAPGSGYDIVAAYHIYDDGTIIALGEKSSGTYQMLTLKPISGLDPTYPGGDSTDPDSPPASPGGETSVPEPTTLATLALAAAGMAARLRRS